MKLFIAVLFSILTIPSLGMSQTCNITKVDSSSGPCYQRASGHFIGAPGNEIWCWTGFVCIDPVLGYSCYQSKEVWMGLWWSCEAFELFGDTETQANRYSDGGYDWANAQSTNGWIFRVDGVQANCNTSGGNSAVLGFYCP